MASADEQTGARFFKIILHSTVRDKKLLLPRKFIRDSAGGLLRYKSATLKPPSGEEWGVEIVKEGGDVWFAGGWQRFAEFYSLQHGHLLVFEYFGGSSQFSVVIFGRSATEIEYPVREVITIEDSAPSVEVLDGGDHDMDAAVTAKSPMAGEAGSGQMKRKKNSCWKQESDSPIEEKQQQQQQAACSSASKQQRPFFQVEMSPSYMDNGQLHIPRWFTRKHIKRNEEWLKLEAGGKDWTVGLTGLNRYMKLGFGWKSFMEENALKLGDVCNFELVGGGWTDVRLKVTVVRA